ncbi:MAG: glycerol-3-phosphate 1-O-acyltransferase PlsY [Acidimicrobiia bacterium]
MPVWLALLGAYVVGSIDFAVVVARSRGIDIHAVGSGNPGTSNVLRTLGKGPAAMVLVGDMLKGVIAAAFGWVAAGGDPANQPVAYLAGLLAVVGHAYPVFHRFRGGKGVATAGGVMLFTVPIASLILAVEWALVAKVFKVASIASLIGAVGALPLAYLFGARGWSLFWLGAMLVLIVWRHRPNIRRMIEGSEQRVPT